MGTDGTPRLELPFYLEVQKEIQPLLRWHGAPGWWDGGMMISELLT